MPALSWVDWTLLAVLGLSMIVGLVRGLVFECLSLAGWLAAWFGALWLAPQLAPHLPVGADGSVLRLGAAFAASFIAVLIVWTLLARGLRMLIHATPLSLPDRLLGALFGLLRGAVLLLVLAIVVALTPASQSQGWRASKGAQTLASVLTTLKPLLPEPAARLVRG